MLHNSKARSMFDRVHVAAAVRVFMIGAFQFLVYGKGPNPGSAVLRE